MKGYYAAEVLVTGTGYIVQVPGTMITVEAESLQDAIEQAEADLTLQKWSEEYDLGENIACPVLESGRVLLRVDTEEFGRHVREVKELI